MSTQASNLLALDVGGRRVGVAFANYIARLPRPLVTLINDENIFSELKRIVGQEQIGTIIVGLPRNLSGDDTHQTEEARQFAAEVRKHIDVPIVFQDEALTSKKAEKELVSRGKPFTKADIDALAAVYILDDYLQQSGGVHA